MTNEANAEPGASLVKENLAVALKEAITEGRLKPGDRVVEGYWAREFGAAQASVREAINLLIAEGFLVKDAGRSARVVQYGKKDVVHIYEVRAAIEGLAARLACAERANLSRSQAAFEGMAAAVERRDVKELLERDLDFHIGLLEAPNNPVLAEIGRRLLFPLFAFIQTRILKKPQGPETWSDDLDHHRLILQVIAQGNPTLAAEFVEHTVKRFGTDTYEVWRNLD